MKFGINTDIAFTYLLARKRQTAIAALGVTFGISMYIFMNSIITGTNEYFEKTTLNTTPHIRLYHDNETCNTSMLDRYNSRRTINLISNPQLVPEDNRFYNPLAVVRQISENKEVREISMQVTANVIYSSGTVEQNGTVYGVNILEQDKMFDIASTMLSGSVSDLDKSIDGILIGSGLARKLSLKTGDRVRLVCFNGGSKMLRVVGVFRTTIKSLDDTKTYVNIPVVQQLLQKDRNYITDIYINIRDHTESPEVVGRLGKLTGYTAEAWQTANQQSLAARQIRDIIANAMIMAILVVAGFGIYNILNMVIYEKIKEIAILKATGFAGKHIVSVFIGQALFIGIFGSLLGLLLGYLISFGVSRIYIGLGNVSYLPMAFYTRHYIQGLIFGITTAFFAGYVPSVKASKVDPVKIIRG